MEKPTRKQLNEYIYIRANINAIEEEIEQFKRMNSATYSNNHMRIKLNSLINRLEEEKKNSIEQIKTIESWITNVDDQFIKKALIMRYVKGEKWNDISIKLYGSRYQRQALYRQCERFVEKELQKKNPKEIQNKYKKFQDCLKKICYLL